jgi:hypothetical protein
MKFFCLLLCLGIAVVQASLAAPVQPGVLPKVSYILGYSLAGDTATERLLVKMDEILPQVTGLLRATWPEESFETLLKEAVSGFLRHLDDKKGRLLVLPSPLGAFFKTFPKWIICPTFIATFPKCLNPSKSFSRL